MPAVTGAVLENPSAQLEVVIQWLQGLCTKDMELLTGVTTEDYTHHVSPKTLGIPIRSKQAFLAHHAQLMDMFKDFDVEGLEVTEVPGRIVIHALSKATTIIESSYVHDFMMTAHVVKQSDGQYKVSKMEDFVDSQYIPMFFAGEWKKQEAADHPKGAKGDLL